MSSLGVVAIGRNEGERLRRCLESVLARPGTAAVYVDSGSTDGSVTMARQFGAHVVELDMTRPFTAARARNAGFAWLVERHPQVEFVQFVDGDCEAVAGWLERAEAALRGDPKLAVVCGRRRERHPDASVYNLVCDIEWNTPVGPARACGGDAMMRVAVLREVGGYNPELIAGEEPEMCLRLRQRGWRVERLDAEMTLHDAAMDRFSQWWKRMKRAGYAFAEVSRLHPTPPFDLWVRDTRSNWFWGAILPAVALVCLAAPLFSEGLWPLAPAGGALLLGYPYLIWKVYRRKRLEGYPARPALAYAALITLGKFAMVAGQLRYWAGRISGRRSRLIEYKGPGAAAVATPQAR